MNKISHGRDEATIKPENPPKLDEKNGEIDGSTQETAPVTGPLYTVMSEGEKIFTIIMLSVMNVMVFFSASLFYPALVPLSKDLNVSTSSMYLTITAFMIAQGLAPLFTGNLSDQKGRRPILIVCLLISIATNIGLARQTNFAILLPLRCFQSFGSGGLSVVTIASLVDMVTRGERGKYMAYSSIGSTVGTAAGPVLGGVLTQFLGWRSIFWFLAIFSGVLVLMVLVLLRETCRAVVGNGSIPPQPWNKPLIQPRVQAVPDQQTRTTFSKRPSIFDSLRLLYNKQVGPLMMFVAIASWGHMAIIVSIPVLMTEKYKLNALQVGLCYIPFAIGGIMARWSLGSLADWNFRRHGHRIGLAVERNKQTKEQLEALPLEKIRLEIVLPALYLSCAFVVIYSWILAYNVHLAGPLIMLFFMGNAITGMTNTLGALVMDLQAYRPGMANAAMSILRSLPGAGVIAGVNPAINAIGIGWLGTIVAGVWLLSSSMLWVSYVRGQNWRKKSDAEP